MFSNFAVPQFYTYPPWYLMQYDWLVPSMRQQVIQDSLFSRLGSGPFSGRGKRESRNRTNHKKNREKIDVSLHSLTFYLFIYFSPTGLITNSDNPLTGISISRLADSLLDKIQITTDIVTKEIG